MLKQVDTSDRKADEFKKKVQAFLGERWSLHFNIQAYGDPYAGYSGDTSQVFFTRIEAKTSLGAELLGELNPHD